MDATFSRRRVLAAALVGSAGVVAPRLARAAASPAGPSSALMARAMSAFDRHPGAFTRDLIAIADFDAASSVPRFHLVNLVSGGVTSLLVAHGRGSDPDHSGWVKRLSNAPGSAASSAGAYRTGPLYVGKHGQSRRIAGLDPTNNNAEPRAIVVHGAWYVSQGMVRDHGKLGRSEGCFAVAENVLPEVLARLGEGRLIYADRLRA
ncbi:murein L,D-transpeptidase catalytic domain family protein [Phenylobacterium sp.]|uniref:murein L,D-transpeptidase catalytic domain family protein n=1 Tax=Phenylobacterium sp. TaxID=1871053 RepID=UPI0027316DEB|nr:murein L,D-transpeptidase catalytic domain family protein [Phenylobacterium sp.]MDP1600748.1 murein L,D-transpeptidase catalytic domain family protein [Phenylobacterium sp.]MDP3590255.1 murein L,D-transpeptidase catalytic domain family protein [Phenylobacterium sp.]